MALTCIEKIIGLVIILIVFSLIFKSKSENVSCVCGGNCPCGMNCNCETNCPCRRGGRCSYVTSNFGTPYDNNY